jgi:hypothetical protein
MAISLTAGELYVVGETDPRTGKEAPFVKVGIVRDNENRTTDQRLKEHQTGNPRLLRVRGIVKSPMVERVETALHDRFAPHRVSGEWFHMDAGEVAEVLSTATTMAKRAKRCLPFVTESAELKKVVSDDTVLPADKLTTKLFTACTEADALLKRCGQAAAAVRTALIEARGSKIDVSDYLRLTEKTGSFSIDQPALEQAHPKIFKRFQVTKEQLTQRFALASVSGTSLDLVTVHPELADCIAQIESRAAAVTRKGTGFDKLHGSYLTLVCLQAPIEWDRELAEEELRARCGRASAIEGICKWRRTMSLKTSFDTTAFKQQHPDLAETFGVLKSGTTAYFVAKDRNYRL